MLGFELKRAFCSRFFAAAVIIGCTITVSDIFGIFDFLHISGDYPPSLYQYWIGTEFRSLQNTLYFMLAPVLAALPFADSFSFDRRGYINQICSRTDRKKYLAAKYFSVLASGGLAFVLPLIINFLAVACICPALPPQATPGTFSVYENGFLSVLFIKRPLLYCGFYVLYDFLLAGLLATVSLTAALFVKNRLAVLLSPFIVYLLWSAVTNGADIASLNVYNLLRASQGFSPKPTAFTVTAVPAALFLLTFPLYFIKGSRDDII